MKHTHEDGTVCEHDHAKESEMQALGFRAQMIADQMDKIDSNMMELDYLKNSLEDFKKIKKGNEFLAPLTNGIFVKTRLDDNSKLLVNVGNGVVVEKTVDETKEMLNEKFSELNKIRDELVSQMQEIEHKLIEMGEQ